MSTCSRQGRTLDAGLARELAAEPQVILVCGRYEGVDERVAEHLVDGEISIGDYVLSGGELAAAVVVDAVARSCPASSARRVRAERLLQRASWTIPNTRAPRVRGHGVPAVLFSGDTRDRRWRRQESSGKTAPAASGLVKVDALSPKTGIFWGNPEGKEEHMNIIDAGRG